MTQISTQELEAQILDLLETEQALLLEADFNGLGELSDKKEGLVTQLRDRDEETNPERTDTIRSKAKRNAALYEAALSGLGQAIDRISEIRATLGKITTYDDRGLVTTTDTGAPSVSIKA